jgi:hypothetical protein
MSEMCQQRTQLPHRRNEQILASVQRAPFKVHDVVQVVVTPWSHFLQTATH